MKGITRLLLLNTLLLLCNNPIVAQSDTIIVSSYFKIPIDSVEIEQRIFDQSELEEYRTQPQYNYDNDPKYDTNLFALLKGLFIQFIENTFGEKGAKRFWDFFEYGIILFGAGFLIYTLLRMNRSSILQKEAKKEKIVLSNVDESAGVNELDELLRLALDQNNFKIATRIQFLKILKTLDMNKIITWKEYKTNLDFSNEIKTVSVRTYFDRIRWTYENVWYGGFSIDAETYSSFEKTIQSLNEQITSG